MKFQFSILFFLFVSFPLFSQEQVYQSGHSSLQHWLLPDLPVPTQLKKDKAFLGKQLFFDPRLSASGYVSCATCHSPEKGWEDGLAKSVKFDGKHTETRAKTLVNAAFSTTFLWNGSMSTLENEAYATLSSSSFINAGATKSLEQVIDSLRAITEYEKQFNRLYPAVGITRKTIANAIAAFEKTIISNNSPFDQWIKGDAMAMSNNQVEGFKLFSGKARCHFCHQAPNFDDSGFHNIGLKSFAENNHLIGRKKIVPLKMMDGAFKTPTLRDIALRAPYFHDGSAKNLNDVKQHYLGDNQISSNLSPSFNQSLVLTHQEEQQIIEFLEALTSIQNSFIYPKLPKR